VTEEPNEGSKRCPKTVENFCSYSPPQCGIVGPKWNSLTADLTLSLSFHNLRRALQPKLYFGVTSHFGRRNFSSLDAAVAAA
jgi:hypothetical protein